MVRPHGCAPRRGRVVRAEQMQAPSGAVQVGAGSVVRWRASFAACLLAAGFADCAAGVGGSASAGLVRASLAQVGGSRTTDAFLYCVDHPGDAGCAGLPDRDFLCCRLPATQAGGGDLHSPLHARLGRACSRPVFARLGCRDGRPVPDVEHMGNGMASWLGGNRHRLVRPECRADVVLSQAHEKHRISNTGNVYTRVFYEDRDKRWYPFDDLRTGVQAVGERHLLHGLWAEVEQKLGWRPTPVADRSRRRK